MNGERYIWTDLFSKKNETEFTVLSTLRQNQLFRRLSLKEYQYVAKIVHVRSYHANELIFSQGEKGLGMYMIARGAVEIRVRSDLSDSNFSTTSASETLSLGTLVTNLGEGSFFGELALVDESNTRSATALAIEPTILLGFFKPDLMEIIERRPALGVKILLELSHVLGKRLSETTDQIGKIRSDGE